MIWSTRNMIANIASTAATKAPVSSCPSIAMLMTPARSPSRPASAPSISGMDAVRVPCSRSMTWSGPTELPASAQASSDSRKQSSTTAMDSRFPQRGRSTTARTMPRPIEIAPSTYDVSAPGTWITGRCGEAPGSDSAKRASQLWAKKPKTKMSIRPSAMNVPAARYLRLIETGTRTGAVRVVIPTIPSRRRLADWWRRCGDEEHDQGLDDADDVGRDAGRGLHDRAAGGQRAEQQPGEDHAPWPGPAEQRDRDAVEAVRAVAGGRQRRRLALHDRGRRQPGQAAGDQKREHPDPLHADAGAARRARARAHGPELEANRAAREQPGGRGRGGHRDQEPDPGLRRWPPNVRQHRAGRDGR